MFLVIFLGESNPEVGRQGVGVGLFPLRRSGNSLRVSKQDFAPDSGLGGGERRGGPHGGGVSREQSVKRRRMWVTLLTLEWGSQSVQGKRGGRIVGLGREDSVGADCKNAE